MYAFMFYSWNTSSKFPVDTFFFPIFHYMSVTLYKVSLGEKIKSVSLGFLMNMNFRPKKTKNQTNQPTLLLSPLLCTSGLRIPCWRLRLMFPGNFLLCLDQRSLPHAGHYLQLPHICLDLPCLPCTVSSLKIGPS